MSLQDDIDRQQRNKNPFHRFLLKHRPYCDLCSGPIPAMHVLKIGFNNKVLCDAHYRAHTPIETGLRNRARITRADLQTTGEKIPYFGHMRKTK